MILRTIYKEKYIYLSCTRKIERERERARETDRERERERERAFSKKVKIYQQDVLSWCIQERLKILDLIVIKSHNTCTSELSSSMGFGCLSPGLCAVSS